MTTIVLPKILIGLYSPRAAELYGSTVYLGIDGKEHFVTAVAHDEEWIPKYMWDDAIRIGYVTRYLRLGQRGSLSTRWVPHQLPVRGEPWIPYRQRSLYS